MNAANTSVIDCIIVILISFAFSLIGVIEIKHWYMKRTEEMPFE